MESRDDASEAKTQVTTDGPHPWACFVNPVLAGLYSASGLDKRFVRAEGHVMEDADGRRYIDFLAGYGSLPLGHHPADLWQVVLDLHARREPVFSIPSVLDGAGALAKGLVEAAASTSPCAADRVRASGAAALVQRLFSKGWSRDRHSMLTISECMSLSDGSSCAT